MYFKFPFKNGTLDGVFGLGVRKDKISIPYQLSLSSLYADSNDFAVGKCFDGDPATFCHTKCNGMEHLQVRFTSMKFKIEGFAIRNRNIIGWDPLNYKIQGSNDGSSFVDIGEFHEDVSKVCGNGQLRTNRVYTNKYYYYFRLKDIGDNCLGNSNRCINIAEFDLFGTFGGDDCLCIKTRRISYAKSVCFSFFALMLKL